MPTISVSPNPVAPGKRLDVVGSAFSPASGVQVTMDGITYIAKAYPTNAGTFAFSLPMPSTPGTHTVTAKVGGKIVASAGVVVAVPPPPPPPPLPALAFTTTIADGATLTKTVPWTASVTAGTATGFDFNIDGATLWPEKDAPWGGDLDTTGLTNGGHTLTVLGHAVTGDVAKTARVTVSNAVTPPPLPPVATKAHEGPDINGDTKSNVQNHDQVAHRFVSPVAGTIVAARFQARGGPVYSGGNGGTYRIGIQGDNSGIPSGTWIGPTVAFTPGNPGVWTTYPNFTGLSASVARGQVLYLVVMNLDVSPNTNYFSVNEIFLYGSSPLYLGQRQPRYRDSDYAVVARESGTWVAHRETADMDITYADGTHAGQSYVGMIGINGMAVYAANITGSTAVRQTMAPAGPIVVVGAAWRLRRTSGSSPATISLHDTSGAILGSIDIPANDVPQSAAGGDNGGSAWVEANFAGPITFTGGDLRVTTTPTTIFTAAAIRSGEDVGFTPSLGYAGGVAQVTSNGGTSWASIHSAPLDFQCFLKIQVPLTVQARVGGPVTSKAKPATDQAYLQGHHFMAADPEALCGGCHRSLLELVNEARAADDDISVCTAPHADSESGQLLHIGPNWP